MKHSTSQVIWGAMWCRGAAGLCFTTPNTTMNEPKHVELLKGRLKLNMPVQGCAMFMQDGAACHRSKVAIEILKNNICTGMARDQPRLQSIREHLDYYEG